MRNFRLKRLSMKNIFMFCGETLFFLMLVFPQTYQVLKIPFLGITLLGIIATIILYKRIYLHPKIFVWFSLYLFFGFIWSFLGFNNNKEFALDFMRLNVAWVIIFMLLVIGITQIRTEKDLIKIEKKLILSTFVICLLNINYFLFNYISVGIPYLANLNMGQNIGIHSGYSQLSTLNIGSLYFLIPYLISIILINKKDEIMGYSKFYLRVSIVMAIITTFLSGRRMLIIVVMLTPFILKFFELIAFVTKKAKIKLTKVILYSTPIIIMLFYIFYSKLGWDINSLVERLTFSGAQGRGVVYRFEKIKDLIDDVLMQNIFFGTGGGSPGFEVSFVKIFHETGLLGSMIYLGLYLWVYIKLFYIMKKTDNELTRYMSLLVGGVTFFLAMWTNPFFSFDFMWTIMLPIAFINRYLIKPRNEEKNE